MAKEHLKIIGPTLVLGMLIAFGGVGLTINYWNTSDTNERIKIVTSDPNLTENQKVILLQIITVSGEHPASDREALSNYFRDISKNMHREGTDEINNAGSNESAERKGFMLQRAGLEFSQISKIINDPNTDPEKLIIKMTLAFKYLKEADKTLADFNMNKALPVATSTPILQDNTSNKWTGVILAMAGVAVTFLGGMKAWVELKKSKIELEKTKRPAEVNAQPSESKIIIP